MKWSLKVLCVTCKAIRQMCFEVFTESCNSDKQTKEKNVEKYQPAYSLDDE